MKKLQRSECAIHNVCVDDATFARIYSGEQKEVYDYWDNLKQIERWYDKSEDKFLVVEIDGPSKLYFECIGIWDTENWSWFGWIPDDTYHDGWDEPADEHFVLYIGEQIRFKKREEVT